MPIDPEGSTYLFLVLLLEVHDEDRAGGEERRRREGELGGAGHGEGGSAGAGESCWVGGRRRNDCDRESIELAVIEEEINSVDGHEEPEVEP